MTNDNTQIEILDSRQKKVRLILAAAVICALVFGWFAVRWQLGNLLAENAIPTAPGADGLAEIAVDFAPNDPLAMRFMANIEAENLTGEKNRTAVRLFEEVVRRSPNDFRRWIELGRAYEQADEFQKAEQAIQYAINLAPNYTFSHWQFGNFYLRQNRADEAFAELKKAAENHPIYREQVLSIAWDYYEKDKEKLERLAGDSPAGKAGLARFYAVKEQAADSLKIWNQLSVEEKEANSEIARIIAQAMYEKRFFRSAVAFIKQLGIEPEAMPESVTNAGFETKIGDIKETFFGWKVLPKEKIDVKLDPTQKHEGSRSLRVSFNGFTGVEIKNITQIVTVEASKRYVLSFWLKTENLKSAGTPNLEIINASDDKIIAASGPFPNDSSGWSNIKIEFNAPENAEAVVLRVDRSYCGDSCPIVGTIWFDDFRLERVG